MKTKGVQPVQKINILAGIHLYVMSSILLVKHQTDVSHQFLQF